MRLAPTPLHFKTPGGSSAWEVTTISVSQMLWRDCGRVLGVALDASAAQIKAAFRQQALQVHPDVSSDPEAEDKFKLLARAYGVLPPQLPSTPAKTHSETKFV